MNASQTTRAIKEKPEIGAAAGGGDCGVAGCGAAGADAAVALAGAAAAAAGAGAGETASCFLRLSANCFISCAAVAWIMPTPRPYCATAPDSVRLVCTSTLEPPPAGSSRKTDAALAPP